MENKNRSNDKKASNQSSDCNCFPEQALRTGYMGSYAGRFHSQCPLDNSQPQPQPHFHAHAQPHHHPMLQPHYLQEAIQREIEKQHIREEMIISEIARRSVLEAEVRREMMMERELSLRRAEDGFPFGPSLGIGYDSTIRYPFFGMSTDGRSLEERFATSHKENERQSVSHENGEIETLPFQRRITEPRISEVKSVTDMGKEKGKVVLLANPHEYIHREKREAATSSIVDDGELPSACVSRKKAKEDWSCALCQVSATSEQDLKDHVQGKKHKSKEASALRVQGVGKNYKIGLFPKKPAMPVTVVASKTLGSEGVKSEIQEMQQDGNSKKKSCRFWCDMCQVGTFSGIVMNDHKKGKKHMKRLQEFDQNGAELSSLKKAIVQVNDTEWVGKNNDAVGQESNVTMDATKQVNNKHNDPFQIQYTEANDAEWTV